jgi:hypothetical protein
VTDALPPTPASTPTSDTVPPPTPGDNLLGRVILGLVTIVIVALVIVGAAIVLERAIPDVLGTVIVAGVTALGAVLAGRSRA